MCSRRSSRWPPRARRRSTRRTSTSSSSTSSTTPPRRPYRALLDHLEPRVLLGLTATPERTDGETSLDWFDGRIAAELRLWDAIDEGLLVPVPVLRRPRRRRLSQPALAARRLRHWASSSNLYTGNDARAARCSTALDDQVARPSARCARSASASASSTPSTWRDASRGAASRAVAVSARDAARAERRGGAAAPADARDQRRVRRRPLQRGRRRPRGRHRAVPAAHGERDRVPAAARPRPAARRGKAVPDGARLHRPAAPAIPVRLGASGRFTGSTSQELDRASRAWLPVPAVGVQIELDRDRESLVLENIRQAARRTRPTPARRRASGDRATSRSAAFLDASGRDLEDVFRPAGVDDAPRGAPASARRRVRPDARSDSASGRAVAPRRRRDRLAGLPRGAAPHGGRPVRGLRRATSAAGHAATSACRPTAGDDGALRRSLRATVAATRRCATSSARCSTSWLNARHVLRPLGPPLTESRSACTPATRGTRSLRRSAWVNARPPRTCREGVRGDEADQTDVFFVTLQKSERGLLALHAATATSRSRPSCSTGSRRARPATPRRPAGATSTPSTQGSHIFCSCASPDVTLRARPAPTPALGRPST